MNRLISRQWGLAVALLAMPVWATAQPVDETGQRPANAAPPPRDRLLTDDAPIEVPLRGFSLVDVVR